MIEDEELNGLECLKQINSTNEFIGCVFKNAVLTEIDLSNKSFSECTFIDCDLSLAKLLGTHFKEIVFKKCKMLGMHFENCNPFLLEMHFSNCQLSHASFYSLALSASSFHDCKLREVDFTEAKLTKSKIINCDMEDARFEKTQAEKADFSNSFNINLDPEINNISEATFSQAALPGLLNRYALKIIN